MLLRSNGEEDKKELLVDKGGTGGKLLVSGDGKEDRLLCDGEGAGTVVETGLMTSCSARGSGSQASCSIKCNHLIM